MKIKKAIIPAAGLGTRFLPATKAQPKEMLPIVDKPTIQYIVEEAVQSGIEDIMIVTGRGKRAIEDHFDKSYELEAVLASKKKTGLLQEVENISNMVDIHYIRQKEAKGLGHAIWCARKFVGDEPFAVLLGDDIVVSEEPCLKQLIHVFERYHSSVIGVQQVEPEDISQYGVIKPNGNPLESGVHNVIDLVEKPKQEDAPSNMAIMGRYVLRPEIFNILRDLPPGAGGEIQLTDALRVLNRSQAILGYEFTGRRYDVGNKLGFIQATVDFALNRNDLRDDVLRYLEETLDKNKEALKG